MYIPNIILLAETEEFSNLGGSLGTKSLWLNDVGQTWNIAFALLDNAESKDRQILSNDATTD